MVPGTTLQVVPVSNEILDSQNSVICIVQDETALASDWKAAKFHINLPRSTTVHDLYVHTGKEFSYDEDSFLLVWKRVVGGQNGEEIELKNELQNMSLEDVGLPPEKKKQRFYLRQKDGISPVSTKSVQEQSPCENSDDVLADGSVSNLFDSGSASGATASGTSYAYYGPYNANSSSSSYGDLIGKSTTGYVGLVNQAMTCYLNSLLQTLFMTPEFRNAIYKWKFEGNNQEAEKSIPYQLQRLFVHLQFSSKRAVETTDVTKSFGWDSSDAWQQHDVQELCRVMFDTLEKVFKDTDQAHLINQLYQGKMKDYVRCLECEHESARSDTYLDIPLVIRPFGMDNNPYGSVEEALDAFVNPETLEGNNQYKCDKCEKFCDAHKGLKFCSFPYLLTMQLKRFAFDYNLLHRVKLNDRMTFPKHLNLNKFVLLNDDEKYDTLSQQSYSPSSIETDSGVSLASSENSATTEDDLGDDVSMDVADRYNACSGYDDLEANEGVEALKGSEGPYKYELFSIMIHSGSAIGGHYYAYIKSFEDNQWYSFNDQTVTKITNSDIKRMFGGVDSSSRGYYSSHYSSSANAYMLMYRQIKSDQCLFVTESELPNHVKELVEKLHQDELNEQALKDYQKSLCKIKLFCHHPVKRTLVDTKFEIHKDITLREATELARKLFDLEDVVSLGNCRLVKYDEYNENLELSYEGKEDTDMTTVLGGVQQTYLFDLLLETKKDDEEFPVYTKGGITVKVYEVKIEEKCVAAPFSVRVLWTDSSKSLQDTIRKRLNTACKHISMVWERYSEYVEIKPSESKSLKEENFFSKNKVFVECTDDEPDVSPNSKLLEVLDNHSNTICLKVSLPNDVYTTDNKDFAMVINKRISLGEFKEKLESKMGSTSEMFKVFRVYSNNQEMEMDRLSDTFSAVPDQSKILIKHGRALKKDEFRCKVFLLKVNEAQHTELLFETIVCKTSTVLESKKNLQGEIIENCKRSVPVEKMRLRKKTWRSPGRILKNDQKYDDIMTCVGTSEVFLEELQAPDPVENDSQLSVYVRRWRPSTYSFDQLEELVIDESATVTDLKTKISSRSDIGVDNIEIAKGRGSFPFDISVLEAHEDLDWNPSGESLRHYPIMVHDDGALFYYRDKNEPLMELSEEKRNEIKKIENAKSGVNSSRNIYKPKEKALKIYTDR